MITDQINNLSGAVGELIKNSKGQSGASEESFNSLLAHLNETRSMIVQFQERETQESQERFKKLIMELKAAKEKVSYFV